MRPATQRKDDFLVQIVRQLCPIPDNIDTKPLQIVGVDSNSVANDIHHADIYRSGRNEMLADPIVNYLCRISCRGQMQPFGHNIR